MNISTSSGLPTISTLRELGKKALHSDLESDVLLAHCLKVSRSYLYTHSDEPVEGENAQKFQSCVQRRLLGEPIAYITGKKEFWSLELDISDAVLIPRPETELIIETVFDSIPKETPNIRLLDLGTGSGAIAVAIAHECLHWEIVAVDKSQAAIEIARQNANNYSLTNIQFYIGNWFEAINEKKGFDIIVSNPPYIANHDPHLNEGDLRFEPKLALVSGREGLDALSHIIVSSKLFLKKSGYLILEQGYNQGEFVALTMKEQGYTNVEIFKDLAGHDRVTKGQLCV